MLAVNSQKIAIKQFIAFVIDFVFISLPLLIMVNLTGAFVFGLLWAFYIPLAELIYGQTIGMKVVGTKIYASSDSLSKISFWVAFRRHIARIGILFGILGWLFMFFNKQYFIDYVIISKDNISTDRTVAYAKNIKNYKNKFFFGFIVFLILLFVAAYIRDRYYESQYPCNHTYQEEMINRYIHTTFRNTTNWNNHCIKKIIELDKELKKDGKALVFYIDGSIKEIADYEKNVLMHLKAFDLDGKLSYELLYNDETHMTQINYHDDKSIDTVIEFKYASDGEPIYDGLRIQYHYDKNYITGVQSYEDGVLHGTSKSYLEDGSLWIEVNNINGKREGIETIYNKDGTISATQFYKNDKLVE